MTARNRTKTVLTLAAVLGGVVAFGGSLQAQIIYEPFDYSAGANINTQNGGVGFGGPWVSTISHGRIYEIQPTGLSFSTLPVAGLSVSRYGSSGRAQAHRPISPASQTALTGDGTTIWFSVLFQEPNSTYKHGSFLFGSEPFTTDGTPTLAAAGEGFGFTIQAAPDGSTQGNGTINALAFNGSTAPTVVAGTFTPNPIDATSLIVGKINWNAPGTPDEFFLFNVTDLSTEPAEGAAIASITILDFDQSAFDTVAIWDSNNAITDEIRFGNTFVDVTTSNFDAAESQLVLALTALKDHVEGTTPLNASQIEGHKLTIDSNSGIFGYSDTIIKACFDLVAAYDSNIGPLWVAGSPKAGGFTRSSVVNDIHWTVYCVMQYIMDRTYTAQNIGRYEPVLDGFKFGSSAGFPGAVNPPADPSHTHTAKINGSYPETWGHEVMHETRPARKPTGTYLAPGSIATITVPSSIVGKGYQVRVGAHSWDFSNKPAVKRLDRSSLVYDIDSTEVKVASPLGGGIYIEVPEHADAGIVDVQIKNAVRSPYFSAKSFHSTTLAEWQNTERHHPGPWADFQSEKFMMQVPTSWIYNYDDPVTLMEDWDDAMDAMDDLMGYRHGRGRETMYTQVDVLLRASVFAPGYPSVNVKYDPNRDYGGNHGHHLLKGPRYAPDYLFHEEGHGYRFQKFSGETESNVNLHHVAVWHQKFGYSLDEAFRKSRGFSNTFKTLDTTAITWMTVFNFSPREQPMAAGEKAYQLKGHAKFVDIARLFGWEVLGDYWYSFNVDYENGAPINTSTDGLILRLAKAVGVDIRPLVHFWGIHPGDPAALAAAITAENLPASPQIYDTLVRYKSLVPADNQAFQDFALSWWGKKPSINGYWTEREHARQWDNEVLWDPQELPNGEIYDESSCARIKAVVDGLIDLYFPDGRPKDPGVETGVREGCWVLYQ